MDYICLREYFKNVLEEICPLRSIGLYSTGVFDLPFWANRINPWVYLILSFCNGLCLNQPSLICSPRCMYLSQFYSLFVALYKSSPLIAHLWTF